MTETNRPLVAIKNLVLRYHSPEGEITALAGINLEVTEGEFIAVVGPSGCGKSTLLSLIAGLAFPSSGEVLLRGRAVSGPSAAVGYMPQTDQLFEWRTVWRNVLLGLEVQNKLTPESKSFAASLLRNYGLDEFRQHYPSQLSGGMRQRVSLIRTLAINPDILLLDEAFSALDYQTRLVVADEVKQIIVQEEKTAVLVTHDIAEAVSMADRVVVLTSRPGTVKSIHPIRLSVECCGPLKRREAPEFREYFNRIWRELDVHAVPKPA